MSRVKEKNNNFGEFALPIQQSAETTSSDYNSIASKHCDIYWHFVEEIKLPPDYIPNAISVDRG